MKRAVVSFADVGHNGLYQKKMKRLEESLRGRTDADFLGFTSYNDIGCESHSVIPYKFKPYAIQKAISLGYDSILWCDSPIHAVKNLEPVFKHIEEHGYMFFDNIGHSLGKWSNQKALDHFGITREEANNIKMIMACCMGFRFSYFKEPIPLVKAPFMFVWEGYIGLADKLYPGSWDDHRHDQTVMSFLIHSFGLEILSGQQTFFMYENHRFAVPINEETICLISE